MEFSVLPEFLGKVIGPKGKTIQTLIETYGLKDISVEDEGNIQIESFSETNNQACKEAICKYLIIILFYDIILFCSEIMCGRKRF